MCLLLPLLFNSKIFKFGALKLQKEKQRKKEKRREKKEKRKERKERRKEKNDKASQNLDKSDVVKGHICQKDCLDTKCEFQHKRREAETEQFEQSSLTEEHGHPDSLPVPSSSSESTEKSNKRKRHTSPIDGSHGHGKFSFPITKSSPPLLHR